MAVSLKDLAAEREARRGGRPATTQPPSTTKPFVSRTVPSMTQQKGLLSSHPSILMARSLGLVVVVLTVLLTCVFGGWRLPAFGTALSVALAKFSASWLHSVAPPMLREGPPPTQDQTKTASGIGIFSGQIFQAPLSCFELERKVDGVSNRSLLISSRFCSLLWRSSAPMAKRTV